MLKLQLGAASAGLSLAPAPGRPLRLDIAYPDLNRKLLDPLGADEEHSVVEQQVGVKAVVNASACSDMH